MFPGVARLNCMATRTFTTRELRAQNLEIVARPNVLGHYITIQATDGRKLPAAAICAGSEAYYDHLPVAKSDVDTARDGHNDHATLNEGLRAARDCGRRVMKIEAAWAQLADMGPS